MTTSSGREYLAIPGPSVMPDRVLRAMHRAAPNIYTGELLDMMPGLIADLKAIAGTSGDVAMYIANGHGAWEAALANVLGAGDLVLVLETGRFAWGWGDVARALGAEVEVRHFGQARPADPAWLTDRLRADKGGRIKAILAAHVDTASSVLSDIQALGRARDDAGHPALLLVDCIASLACDRFEMDAWGVDVMVTGSQKGLMTPPGMGFVFFNDRAAEARRSKRAVSAYWDWTVRCEPKTLYHYFFGTAPTHHLYGLREALDMLKEEGIERVWARHDVLARAIWAAITVWETGGALRAHVRDEAARSRAVTTLRIERPLDARIRSWAERQAGVTLGIGLDLMEDPEAGKMGTFRIGHMGHVNAQMVFGALTSIDASLKALQIPHGDGAIDAAARTIASASA